MTVPLRVGVVAGRGRAARILLWAALAVGLIARVAFLEAKPFWRDEAWVALLVEHPTRAATEGRQVPIGFLVATRAAMALPLAPEVALRLIPLACGLGVVALLPRLATALGAAEGTAVAVAWLAVGFPPLVYYSRELKPYGIDVLLAILVPLLAREAFGHARRSRGTRWTLLLCLAVAPWMSFGGLFPILAVLSWGWLVWWRDADAAARRDWVLGTALLAGSVAAVYVVAWDAQVANGDLRKFWSHHLLGASGLPGPRLMLLAIWRYFRVSTGYLFPTVWPVVLALAAIGAWTWPKPHRAFLCWLYFASAAFCVAAALFDRYLLAQGRLLLFAAPPLLLWSANGLMTLGRGISGGAGPRLALGVAVATGSWWAADAIAHRVGPYHNDTAFYFRQDVLHDVAPVIARTEELVPPGTPVLVSRHCVSAFRFYSHGRLPHATQRDVPWFEAEAFATGWLEEVRDRGWVIVAEDEVDELGPLIDAAGFDRQLRATARGVLLWELTRKRVPGS